MKRKEKIAKLAKFFANFFDEWKAATEIFREACLLNCWYFITFC